MVCEVYPTELMTTVALDCTLNEKAPSAFVLTPLVVPRSRTVAPGRAPPSRAITRPLTEMVCAQADVEDKQAASRNKSLKWNNRFRFIQKSW